MAFWLSLSLVCTAEEPTFPHPVDDDEFMNNQYIVQFTRNKKGEESKQRLFKRSTDDDDDAPRVVRRIDSRNISVVKFRSMISAKKWRESETGVKYFERGEKNHRHHMLES